MKGLYRYAIVVALVACAAPISPVQAQVQTPSPECTLRIRDRANTMYDLGRRDSTIVLLTPCLQEKRFSNEQERRAYRLVALSYFANQDLELAKVWINSLVHEHRDYLIDPDEDPLFFNNG